MLKSGTFGMPAAAAIQDRAHASARQDGPRRRRGDRSQPDEPLLVAEVGLNLLHGAAVQLRGLALRNQGIPLPVELTNCPPLEEADLITVLHCDE